MIKVNKSHLQVYTNQYQGRRWSKLGEGRSNRNKDNHEDSLVVTLPEKSFKLVQIMRNDNCFER